MPKAARQNTIEPTESPDPIFAALAEHQKRLRLFTDTASEHDLWWTTDARHPVARTSRAEECAAWRLAETAPTTIQGASAMLSYITDGPAVGLFYLGETPWHETAFRTVATALKKIARVT